MLFRSDEAEAEDEDDPVWELDSHVCSLSSPAAGEQGMATVTAGDEREQTRKTVGADRDQRDAREGQPQAPREALSPSPPAQAILTNQAEAGERGQHS